MSSRKIRTAEELHSIVNTLRKNHPNLQLVFRGQTHDYFPVSSAERANTDSKLQNYQSVLLSTWIYAASSLLSTKSISVLNDPFTRVIGAMALLQHYGFRSWFIDVTSDPLIAAWFALNKYSNEFIYGKPLPIHQGTELSPYLCDHTIARISAAKYTNTHDDGFLFVFGVPEETGAVFFLNHLLESSISRPHRQKAGELIAPIDGTSLDSLLLETFIVDRNFDLPSNLDARWLFPPPSEDTTYKALLDTPYVLKEDHIDREPLVALPYLIDLPFYMYGSEPEPASFQNWNLRVIVGIYGPYDFADSRCKVVRLPLSRMPEIDYELITDEPQTASNIELNILLRQRKRPGEKPDFSVWGSKEILLLYPLHQMLVTFFLRRAAYPVFRGLHIKQKPNGNVEMNAINETADHMMSDLIEHDKDLFLEDLYFLTEKLNTGEAVLIEKGPESHYEWRDWSLRRHKDPLAEFRRLYIDLLSKSRNLGPAT